MTDKRVVLTALAVVATGGPNYDSFGLALQRAAAASRAAHAEWVRRRVTPSDRVYALSNYVEMAARAAAAEDRNEVWRVWGQIKAAAAQYLEAQLAEAGA